MKLVSTHIRLEPGQAQKLQELFPDQPMSVIIRKLVAWFIKRTEDRIERETAHLEMMEDGHDS